MMPHCCRMKRRWLARARTSGTPTGGCCRSPNGGASCARSPGRSLETETDAMAVAEFDYRYHATLSVDDTGRATALAMTVTKEADTLAVSANLEVDAVVVTRVMTSMAEGAVQRTQTFRMEPGYTIEAHPVLFDGLHVAALDRHRRGPSSPVPLDGSADERSWWPDGGTAHRLCHQPASGRLARDFRDHPLGNDVEMAESLLTVKYVAGWAIPTEFRFTMAGILYSARSATSNGRDDVRANVRRQDEPLAAGLRASFKTTKAPGASRTPSETLIESPWCPWWLSQQVLQPVVSLLQCYGSAG